MRAMRVASYFAPARIHVLVSLLIFVKTVRADDSTRLKTRAFLSSQISQMTRRRRERVPWRLMSGASVKLFHHCRTESLRGHSFGCR
jgi:hypothetical protein